MLQSRSDLVVSHDLVGLLHRLPGFFSWLFVTVQDAEGLAGLLRPAANRRVRCVSFASSGGARPGSVVIAGGIPCWSLGFAVPRIEVRTPRRIPPTHSFRRVSAAVMRCRTIEHVTVSLPPRTFQTPSIRDLPDVSVSRFAVPAVSMGCRPSRLCSVSGSVPSSVVLGRSLAYPPWALFPFEVAFRSILSDRPNFDDALHHRCSAPAYHCRCVRPIHCCSTISRGSVRRAPCRVQFLCARDPSFLRNPTYSSSVCTIHRMMPRRLVAFPSRSAVLPPLKTSESRGVTRVRLHRRFADPPSSCGVLSDTMVSMHREVHARSQ